MGCHNNSSNGTSPGSLDYTVQTSVALTILVGILILLTVFGNVLVVIAVFTSKALRAPQNLFLVSLAWADILVATLVIPFSLSNELLGHWSFGQVWCEIYLALDVLFCTSSIIHLCAISLDRYWSVTQNVDYSRKRMSRRIKSIVFIVWVLAAIISFPPLISTKKKLAIEEGRSMCMLNDEKWYILFSSTASFFAPCIIMITVYLKIFQVAKKRSRALPGETGRDNDNHTDEQHCGLVRPDAPERQGRREGEEGREEAMEGEKINAGVDLEEVFSSIENNLHYVNKKKRSNGKSKVTEVEAGNLSPKTTGDTQPCDISPTSDTEPCDLSPRGDTHHCFKGNRWRGRQNQEKHFTLVLAVVMGVCMICWFPFFFTYTLKALCGPCCLPETLFKVFFWFGYCNSCLNPVIYIIFSNDFRQSFQRILCKRYR